MRRIPLLLLLILLLVGCDSSNVSVPVEVGTVAPISSYPPGPQSKLRLFVEPDDSYAPLLDQLNGARKSIRMVMYLLSDSEVINALIAAQQHGVNVRVMLEQHPFGGGGSNQTVADQLTAAGVDVHWSNPVFRFTHQKAVVVDDQLAIIMTLNASRSAFSKNREYGVLDSNPDDVREVSTVFDADWLNQTPRLDRPNLVWSNLNSRRTFLGLIDRARRTLEIEAEEVNDEEVSQHIADAARRGVAVRLISPAPSGNQQAANPDLQRITSAGGQTQYMARNRVYMHAKAFIVDGNLAWIGSVNISTTSLDQNRELGIIFNDGALVNRLRSVFERDWKASAQ